MNQLQGGGRARTRRHEGETPDPLPTSAARQINAKQMSRLISELFAKPGVPRHIRSDNGPETTAKRLREYPEACGVKALYIEPGSPCLNVARASSPCLAGRHRAVPPEPWRSPPPEHSGVSDPGGIRRGVPREGGRRPAGASARSRYARLRSGPRPGGRTETLML